MHFRVSQNFEIELSFSKRLNWGMKRFYIKIHYEYHGNERCGRVDKTFNSLDGMDRVAILLCHSSKMKFRT